MFLSKELGYRSVIAGQRIGGEGTTKEFINKYKRYKKAADLSGLDSDSAGVGVKSHIYFGTCAAQDLLSITGALAALSRHTHLIQATH